MTSFRSNKAFLQQTLWNSTLTATVEANIQMNPIICFPSIDMAGSTQSMFPLKGPTQSMFSIQNILYASLSTWSQNSKLHFLLIDSLCPETIAAPHIIRSSKKSSKSFLALALHGPKVVSHLTWRHMSMRCMLPHSVWIFPLLQPGEYRCVQKKKKREKLSNYLFLAAFIVQSTFQYNVSSTLCISIGLCMTNQFLKDDYMQNMARIQWCTLLWT